MPKQVPPDLIDTVAAGDGAPAQASAPGAAQASWFGPAPAEETSVWSDPTLADGEPPAVESTHSEGQSWRQPPFGGGPHKMGRRATDAPRAAMNTTAAEPQRATFFRIYRLFLSARVALALVLLSLVMGAWLLGNNPPAWMILMTIGYAAVTTALWALPSQRRTPPTEQQALSPRQALASIGLDLIFFALMHYLTSQAVNSQAFL